MTNATREEFFAAKEPSGPPDVTLWQILRGQAGDPLTHWTDHSSHFSLTFSGLDAEDLSRKE
jgi:hypothetical protein